MNIARTGISAVLPAAIVAARFIVLESWDSSYTWFFATTGFLATLFGCGAAAVFLHRRISRTPILAVTGISVVVAGVLLTIFPTMPSWPFTGEGFVVAWVLMSAGFMTALLFAASYRYA
jgi:peptidoglycan/LPS O-acetylase OafA/YrhL